MKKFLESVDASTRLLDSESRSGSSGALCDQGGGEGGGGGGGGLYQNYPTPTAGSGPSGVPSASGATPANGDGYVGPSAGDGRDGAGGEGDEKEKNGRKFKIGGRKTKDAKVHRIREPVDGRGGGGGGLRVLCSVGCCGQGRIEVTWLNRIAAKGYRSEYGTPQHTASQLADSSSSYDPTNSSSSSAQQQQQQQQQLIQYASERPVTSDDPESTGPGEEKLGRLQFSVSYDFQESTLTLRIIRAVDLVAKDFSGTSDPYVKIMLLPDKKRKLTTNVKRKNLNPRWNEVFAFEGFPYHKLLTRTLYLQVLDYDRFSRDDPIGEICIPMTDIDLVRGQTLWKNLQISKGHAGRLGEVNIGLCYQPTTGQLTVVVHEARQLKAKDLNGLSDPYVKIWLLADGKKTEKKKTTTKEKTLNPVFEETFVFTVPYEKIRQASVSVSVMDYDRMGRNEQIGQVVLGTKSGAMEMKHWNEMFAKTRQEVTQWHILKDLG